MSDIVERLREASVERQQIAWGRIDGGQEWSIAADLADQAAGEIERLVALIDNAAAHWIELCRTIHPPIPFEGAIDGAMEAACKEVKRLRARVAELEAAHGLWRPTGAEPATVVGCSVVPPKVAT